MNDLPEVRIERIATIGKAMSRIIERDVEDSPEKTIALDRLTDAIAFATGAIYLDARPIVTSEAA